MARLDARRLAGDPAVGRRVHNTTAGCSRTAPAGARSVAAASRAGHSTGHDPAPTAAVFSGGSCADAGCSLRENRLGPDSRLDRSADRRVAGVAEELLGVPLATAVGAFVT